MPMRERYKVAVTKKNIVCMTSPMGGISVTILLYLTKDISKSKGRGKPPQNTKHYEQEINFQRISETDHRFDEIYERIFSHSQRIYE